MKILPKIAFYDGVEGRLFSKSGVPEWECWLISFDGNNYAPAAFIWDKYGDCRILVARQRFWPKTLYFFIHELVHWGIWLCGNFERVHKWHDSFFELIHFGKEK